MQLTGLQAVLKEKVTLIVEQIGDTIVPEMTRALTALERPPEARAEAVEDLVFAVRRGRIRIPRFQRGLQWASEQVLNLFDSIYRGLPIGALLLQKQKAEAARLEIGPLVIDAEEVSDAWWVVDGQQRLTSLAASLMREEPLPSVPSDAFVVYFDVKGRRFVSPTRGEPIPVHWVPLPRLLDATGLSEWIMATAGQWDRDLVRSIFEAGKRLREYKVPLYIVETDEPDLLREIFFRINKSGKPLEWQDVYDALYGHDGAEPSTIRQLAESLVSMGMGRIDEERLTSCLLALRGLDVTRTLAEHHRKDPEILRGAVSEALPVLKQVLAFLRSRAEIPHLRLLPRTLVLEVLTRFFKVHPEPGARTQELLVRWVWRALLGTKAYEERTLRRHGVSMVSADEEASVQALLAEVPRDRQAVFVPDDFDARAASSRLAMLGLASLRPRDLSDGHPIDVPRLIETADVEAFRRIFRGSGSNDPANRILHPRCENLRGAILDAWSGGKLDVLASHAIFEESVHALVGGGTADFVKIRHQSLAGALMSMGDRLAGWSKQDNDRPSLGYLLRTVAE